MLFLEVVFGQAASLTPGSSGQDNASNQRQKETRLVLPSKNTGFRVHTSIDVQLNHSKASMSTTETPVQAEAKCDPVHGATSNAGALPLKRQHKHPAGHQQDAGPFAQGWPFTEENNREDRDENEAELGHRGDLGGLADLQRAEVANPGRARCQTGEAEEEPGLRGQGERVAPVAGKPDEPGKHEEDDPGANQRGQIRVDILNSDLGEDGGEGGDYSMCCIMNDPLPGFGRTVRKNRNKCPGKRSA